MTAPSRPVLRYLGAKWRLAPKIIPWLPPHDIYVEPFGGSAAVLVQKPRVRSEIWNDIDEELVNLFQVLRGPRAPELIRALELTPYARAEFKRAYEMAADPVERARRLLVRSHMAHGTGGARRDRCPGFRVDGRAGQTRVVGEWREFPAQLWRFIDRFRDVALERKPALELIETYDDPGVLIYADPPYLPETRSTKGKTSQGYHVYVHEMEVADHEALLDRLLASRAMVVLSGYPSDLYDGRLQGWRRLELDARAHRNSPRKEVLWINTAASAAHGLFAT